MDVWTCEVCQWPNIQHGTGERRPCFSCEVIKQKQEEDNVRMQ